MIEEKQLSDTEVLNTFLSEIFETRMKEKFPEIELTAENRVKYFKLWANGVAAGLELNRAIMNLKDAGSI